MTDPILDSQGRYDQEATEIVVRSEAYQMHCRYERKRIETLDNEEEL